MTTMIRGLFVYLVVSSFTAESASSFSPILPSSLSSCSGCGASKIGTKATTNSKPQNKDKNSDDVGVQLYSTAADVVLNLSGGAMAASSAVGSAAAPGGGPLAAILGTLNAFYLSYPLLSAVTTCSVKGCLADCIAQRRNNNNIADAAADTVDKDSSRRQPFSFRRNAAYVLYGGGILGVLCDLMYNFVYPFLFGGLDGIVHLIAVVSFDNMIVAPLLWLPPVYFVKAILYGNPMKSGFEKYINDVKKSGLLTKYWAVWWPAQIFNFALVSPHLRVAYMAGISFCWMIILSCLSSNKKE